MRTWTWTSSLLILPLCVAGCASTSATRSGGTPKIRTVASVGDKTLPIVSGTPGATVTAEKSTPELRIGRNGLVSGRVVDSEGRPVPNARVRLAVGGALGGRMHRATTDRSGAFTLRGLRPRANYAKTTNKSKINNHTNKREELPTQSSPHHTTTTPPTASPGTTRPPR
jgi:protocatechuate 3,4-dioxygenase beta subunit